MTFYRLTTALLIIFMVTVFSAKGHPPVAAKTPIEEIFPDPFVSDVIAVQEKHLNPQFWVKSSLGSQILMSAQDIQKFNTNSIAVDDTMVNLSTLPEFLTKEALTSRIRSISTISKYKRIFENGEPVTPEDFARYEANLNLHTIKQKNPLRFAMAVHRTSLRTYPTQELLFSEGAESRDIERFQETALFPADVVVILHESTDGAWYLVQSYNYIGWVQKKHIAVGARQDILAYQASDDFLLITGDKVHTVYNPEVPEVSEIQLDMGVRLPLDRPKELQNNLYGQNPYLSHMVKLPVRQANGSLTFKHALISRNKDVHVGYLPFTEENIILQAFKFLGERYGWGHRYNGRDCTGFVSEVYKSFGILLPRNSGDQGRSQIGENIAFTKAITQEMKIAALKNSKVGDLIYIPGHVLMIIGSDEQPFVIHDVVGLGYLKNDGSFYQGTLNGVSITPLFPLRSSKDHTFVDVTYTIKSIR